MVLLDADRTYVDVNGAYMKLLGRRRGELVGRAIHDDVLDGPVASPAEWKAALLERRFTGEAKLVAANGTLVAVQWAATTEVVTGRRLVLFVALSTSRWGARFRRPAAVERDSQPLSPREREVVRLVAMGSTGPEIADELQIAHHTVRAHVRNAMDKTDARSRAHLVAKALGEGLVPVSSAVSPARSSTGSGP